MKRRLRFQDILLGAMFFCFGLVVLTVLVYIGLAAHYELFSEVLEEPYRYYREYYNGVTFPRMALAWFICCGLTLLALLLVAVCVVCRLRGVVERTRRCDLAMTLCGCTPPISVLLTLSLFMRGLASII